MANYQNNNPFGSEVYGAPTTAAQAGSIKAMLEGAEFAAFILQDLELHPLLVPSDKNLIDRDEKIPVAVVRQVLDDSKDKIHEFVSQDLVIADELEELVKKFLEELKKQQENLTGKTGRLARAFAVEIGTLGYAHEQINELTNHTERSIWDFFQLRPVIKSLKEDDDVSSSEAPYFLYEPSAPLLRPVGDDGLPVAQPVYDVDPSVPMANVVSTPTPKPSLVQRRLEVEREIAAVTKEVITNLGYSSPKDSLLIARTVPFVRAMYYDIAEHHNGVHQASQNFSQSIRNNPGLQNQIQRYVAGELTKPTAPVPRPHWAAKKDS